MPNNAIQDRLQLSPDTQVRSGTVRDMHVLLSPTGAVELNASAAAVLRLCDGTRSAAEIGSELSRGLGTDEQRLAHDVQEFLRVARNHGWVIDSHHGTCGTADTRARPIHPYRSTTNA